MPEIQTADPGRKLQQRYDLVGPTPAPFLSPEIVPVTILDDLTQLDALSAFFERPYEAFHQANTPGPGNSPSILLINPTASGVLCIAEGAYFRNLEATNQILTVRLIRTAVGVGRRGRVRDARITGDDGACGLGTVGFPVAVVLDWRIILPPQDGGPGEYVPLPWILTPGTHLRTVAHGDNTSLGASFFWRERALLEGEV